MHDFENRLELLAHIASLYYDQDKNQQAIADEIGVTRSAVSRLLTEAHKRGIVEHIIHYPWRTSTDLEHELASKFPVLKHVRVLIRQNKSYDEMLKGMGILASQYFNSILPTLKIVGITWGTGLYQMVKACRPQSRPDMEIIQLIGGTGTERTSTIGPLLAPTLANCLGCTCRFLHAPLIVKNEATRRALLEDPTIRETLDRAGQCDLALVGIGGIRPELYNPYRLGYITQEELKELQREGIVGDVAGHHYDIHGEILTQSLINCRWVGISVDTLKKIKSVMAVAGDVQKAEGIYGALQGRHINVLITDNTAANRVLELYHQYS
jgi:DNA-binding transcriptional regulator LsrR (DeoR family)